MAKAVYAGSFDPITNGHLWMIEQGRNLFSELIVAVGVNPEKKSTFSLEERLMMISESTANLQGISVATFENLFLVDYADSVGAEFILRGMRDVKDFEFERGMRNINSDLKPRIQTVFLIPPRHMAEVSSSLVKGLIGPAGWQDVVRNFVPEPVFKRLTGRYA